MQKITVLLLLCIFNISVWGAGIALDKKEAKFNPGVTIKLNYYKAADLQSGAWVGIYKSGFKSNKEHLSYQYIEGEEGSLEFLTPREHGDYEFVLYDSGYDGDAQQRVKFTVSGENNDSVSLMYDRAVYKPASRIRVHLSLLERPTGKAWIGIFPKSAPHGIIDNYLDYKYIEYDKQQPYTFTAPERPGEYDFRIYDDDYGNEIASVSFKVAAFENKDLSLETDKKTYFPQETVKVHFIADKDFPRDAWIGLYSGNVKSASKNTEKYLDYYYIEKRVESDMLFKAPTVKGDYHFKMISSYHGSTVAMTGFSVARSMDAEFLKQKIDKEGKVALYGLYFDKDKSEIRPSSYPTLKVVSELLQAHPEMSIQIEGHTDSQGEAAYNRQLSEKRAQSVKSHLVESLSIAPSRLKAVGYGEERPVNNNASDEEQALNRRVEIVRIEH
jgi:outer membrane protein OmpA-like peptidoglycan-associated protein